ncbi:hypothetical protein J7M23_07155 [Candidatus Sumerlaeota bacterium]|nr:hypothetical protein [Candidatus Sumerlaeota bacterium]
MLVPMPIIVITPIIGWSWPALFPLITAAAGYVGFVKLTGDKQSGWLRGKLTREMETLRTVQIPLDEFLTDVVSEEIGREERLDFRREDMVLTFRKDIRGKFFIEVTGPRSRTARELRELGEQFARQLIQLFAHHRIASELDRRGVQVVEESTTETGDIVLRIRRWN